MLFNIIKKSITDTYNNTSIPLLLVIFMIAMTFLSSYSEHTKNLIVLFILLICMFGVVYCFMAGWFQTIKEIAKNNGKIERSPFGVFLEGVGKNIIPVIIGGILYTSILFAVLILVSKIAYMLFGNLNFLTEDSLSMLQNPKAYADFFKNLTPEQLKALSGWLSINIFAILIINFVFMFYSPSIVKDDEQKENENKALKVFKKPFIAFFESTKFVFKNFLDCLFISVFIGALYLALGVLGMLFENNQVLTFIILFIRIYFISFVLMLVFNYFESKINPELNLIEAKTVEEN